MVVTETWQRRTSTGLVYSEDTSAEILHGPEGPLEVTVYRPRADGFNGQAYSRSVMVNYDPEGRPVLFINPDGTIAQKHYYAPNGRLVRTEDPDYYSQVPHEAIIPLEFQAGGGFRDLELVPRSASAKHFHLTLGGRIMSGMAYLGLDISREGQEAFGEAINTFVQTLANLTAGALDGLGTGFTGGLYKGQLAATFLGADVDSTSYLVGHVASSILGPMALAVASAGTASPWLLGASLTPDLLSVVQAVKEDNGLGVISGLAGFGGAVAAFKSASATADVLLKIEKFASRAELALGGASAFADCEDGEECFVPGTKVLTKSGRKSIEELKLGEEVLSRDEETGQQAYKPVTTRFRGQTRKVVHLTLVPRQARQNGRSERHYVGSTKTGNSEEGSDPDPDAQNLRCTPKHPFYVKDRGWIQAEFLNVGDELVGSEGGDWEVAETKLVWESSETYNLEVADWHTFFVVEGDCGSEGLWVHNSASRRLTEIASNARLQKLRATAQRINKGSRKSPFHNVYPEDPWAAISRFRPERLGDKWVTKSPRGHVRSASGEYIFVQQRGQIYVAPANMNVHSLGRPVSHIDLARGAPVEYAGHIRFSGRSNRGTLLWWNNNSGHYKPGSRFAQEKSNLDFEFFKPLPET